MLYVRLKIGMSRSKQIGYIGETLVAKFLGLKRTGATGTQIYDLDSASKYAGLLKVEVKTGKQIPKLVISALNQVLPHITGNQIPVVVMVPKGVGEKKLGDEAMAIMQLKTLKHILDDMSIDDVEKVTIVTTSGESFVLNKEKEK